MNTFRELAIILGGSIPFGIAAWMWLSKTHPVLTVLRDIRPDEEALELPRAA